MKNFLLTILLAFFSVFFVSSVSATITFTGGFEDGLTYQYPNTINNWHDPQPYEAGPTKLTLVTNPVRKGRYALRTEVQKGQNLGSSGERAEVYNMYGSNGTNIVENEASGTQFYAVSVYLPTDWSPPITNDPWEPFGAFMQLHGPDTLSASPAFAINARDTFYVSIHSGDQDQNSAYFAKDYSLGSVLLGQWVDFVWKIKWAKTPNGTLDVWRRNQGQTNFTNLVSVTGIPTLQYKLSVNGGSVGSHYWKTGLYRSRESFTNILYLDSHTRGDNFNDVVTTAFPVVNYSTPTPTPSTCIPNCTNKACGSDGCGGICGSCAINYSCSNFQCVAPTPTPVPPTPTRTPTPTGGNTYYISTTGNDLNTTIQTKSISTPWKTVQKCLNTVVAGDSCLVVAGTYNEALSLTKTGTASTPINLRCLSPKACIINSDSNKTLVTGGRVDYYIIDGFKFISSFTPADQSDVSIDLGKNVPFLIDSKTTGNHGFIFKNNYVEGAIHFYGHENLVENSEFNGKDIFSNGIIDNFATSFNNTYRNNTIYNYIVRGIWTMNSTDNILVENNIIHDVRHGVDCDGASEKVTRCQVINNTFYNHGNDEWGSGIFLENCFNCVIENNIIHDIKTGPGIFFMSYGNGSSNNWHTRNNIEYRNQNTNTSITGNVIYNYLTDAGIAIKAVNGVLIDHNTVYHTNARPALGFTSDYDVNGVIYCPQIVTTTNNILYKNGASWFCPTSANNTTTNNFTTDPSFINPPTNLYLQQSSSACTAGVGGTYIGAFPCGTIITPTPTPQACIPNCTNKACGSDGCGSSCGSCAVNYSCTNFQCVAPTPTPVPPTPTRSPTPVPPTPTRTPTPTTPGGSHISFTGGFEDAVFTKTQGNNWYEAQPGISYSYWQTRLSRVNNPVRTGNRALRVEVRPGDHYNQTGERAEVYWMYGADMKNIVENEASGTQFYAVSVYLPDDFVTPTCSGVTPTPGSGTCSPWATFQQLHGSNLLNAPPIFAMSARDTYYVQMTIGDLDMPGSHTVKYPIGTLQLGKWVDFVWKIKWTKTPTGSVDVWRRIEGETGFTQVLSAPNIVTLQWKSSVQGGAILDAYWKTGYYTSVENFTRVIYLDSHTRGDNFNDVVATAFPVIGSSTPTPIPPTPTRSPTPVPPTPTRTPTPIPPTPTSIVTGGNTYYVSTIGNDANNGSQSTPWRTIQKAADTMVAGDTVNVLAGDYSTQRVTVTKFGSSGKPITYQAQGAVKMKGFSVSADYITIKSFTITSLEDKAKGIEVTRGGWCIVENNTVRYTTMGGIFLDGPPTNPNQTHDCIVRNNILYRNGMSGIDVRGQNHIIEGNDISNTVQYHPCNISNTTVSWLDADGMRFHGGGHVIRKNKIYDIPFGPAGVTTTACSEANLANLNNDYVLDSHTDCFQTFDGGGDHIPGHDILFEQNYCSLYDGGSAFDAVAGTNVSDKAYQLQGASNLVFQNNFSHTTLGSFLNPPNNNIKFLNNTFIGNPDNANSSGIRTTNATNVTIKNNVFAYQQNSYSSIKIDALSTPSLVVGNNCVYKQGGLPNRPADPGDVWGVNPLFVNESSDDYHLKATSPCIDKGANLGVIDDFDGITRPQGSGYDIGTYEYTGASCIPNCTNKACGDDGCGSSCGSCAVNYSCSNFQCVAPTPTPIPPTPTRTPTPVPPTPTRTPTPASPTSTPTPIVTSGHVYYVSTTPGNVGNDSNPGTIDKPFATLTKGNSVLQPGDTLYVSGDYSTAFTINKSGTAAAPIKVIGQNKSKIISNSTYGINLVGNYIILDGFEVSNATSHGIFTGSKHNQILNNIVHNNIIDNGTNNQCLGINGFGSAIKVYFGGEDILIKNNQVYENCGEGIASTRGIDIRIENNIVRDNYSVNIYVDNSYNVSVLNNQSKCTGINLTSDGTRAKGILLGNERYTDPYDWGSQLHDVLVDGNRIDGCLRIMLYNPINGAVSNFTITNNCFINMSTPYVTVAGATVSNNVACSNISTTPTPTPPACIPNCTNKACGDDGCGSSCGSCAVNYSCTNFQCVAPTPTPTPGPITAGQGIWISKEEIMRLPTSGNAWTKLQSAANSSWGSACLYDNNCPHDVNTLAGALVAVRLNDSAMRNKVISGLQAAMNSSLARSLELSRGLQSYVIAADIINYHDTAFMAWVRQMLAANVSPHTGGSNLCDPSTSTTFSCSGVGGIICTAYRSANNWGGHARASVAAAAIYLNDSQLLQNVTNAQKAFIGVNAPNHMYCEGTDWHADSSHKFGINREGTTIQGAHVSGVLPEDWRRAAEFKWPPSTSGYMWEGMQGFIVTAVILHRAGVVPFNAGDNAVVRTMDMLYGQGEAAVNNPIYKNPAGSDDTWIPWVVNYFAGTNYPTSSATAGKGMGWTDWTHSTSVIGTPFPTATPTPVGPTRTPTPIPPTPTRTPTPTTIVTGGNTYYVATTGNDLNNGSQSSPWRTIQKAANVMVAGDTSYVRGGTYDIPNSGTPISFANSGTTSSHITLKAYPGETPLINGHYPYLNDPVWYGIVIAGKSYIDIEGFTIQGFHAGLACKAPGHHVIFRNNITKYNSENGITANGRVSGTLNSCDYVTIQGNTVHHNGYYTNGLPATAQYPGGGYEGGGSGISIGANGGPVYTLNSDYSHFHTIISQNLIYHNYDGTGGYINPGTNNHTDGNGIIMDLALNYSPTLIENNVIFDNGGACININGTNNVSAIGNTCYLNQTDTQFYDPDNQRGEIRGVYYTGGTLITNITLQNNIIYSLNTKLHVFFPNINLSAINEHNNLFYNGLWRDPYTPKGINYIINKDPLFINPSIDPTLINFQLKNTSPAINTGLSNGLASGVQATDHDGVSRPQGQAYDIGAYEYSGVACTPNCTNKACGDDGCGSSCGSCTVGQSCSNFQCVAPTPTPAPPTPTRTLTPTPPNPTRTPTPVPPTPTRTPTPILPTLTPVPPTPTSINSPTPIPPTSTPIPTITSIPTTAPTITPEPTIPACIPNCTNKACGDDGCNSSCGSCAVNQSCDNYQCIDSVVLSTNTPIPPTLTPTPTAVNTPIPTSTPISPTSTPTSIPTPTIVINTPTMVPSPTIPVCMPSCANKACGDDGCNSSCGSCQISEVCQADYTCGTGGIPSPTITPINTPIPTATFTPTSIPTVIPTATLIPTVPVCIPNCTSKACGDDGCNSSCGSCAVNQSCDNYQCSNSNPTPTNISFSPTPVPTTSTGNVNLNMKLKFQGINKLPPAGENSMIVKITAYKEGIATPLEGNGIFVADSNGNWTGTIKMNIPDVSGKYRIQVKGGHHIQKKICDNVPTEASPGIYRCAIGNITLTVGDNDLNFLGVILLVGDLDQSGLVDSVDFGFVRNNLGKTDSVTLAKADINKDGRVDTQDFSLIIAALRIRTDEL